MPPMYPENEEKPETPAPEPEVTPEPEAVAPETPETPEPEVTPETDPVEFQPEPEPTPVPVDTSDLDKDLNEAIQAINDDEMISPGEKALKRLQARQYHEQTVGNRQNLAEQRETRARDAEARRLGCNRAQLDKAWEQACGDVQKQLGRHSRDAALMLLPTKIAALKKPAAPVKPAATPARDNAGRFAGAEIAPPTGKVATTGGKKATPEEKLERELSRLGY